MGSWAARDEYGAQVLNPDNDEVSGPYGRCIQIQERFDTCCTQAGPQAKRT